MLWLGQLVSFSGSNMQAAAVLWHVAVLAPPDRKGIALGLVGLTRVVPLVGLSLLGGVMADAIDRRRLMVVTQTAMAVAAAVLAALTFRGLHALWPIYVLTGAGFAAAALDAPARQSLAPSLVPREHLPNAISLNTIMFVSASIVGPGLAGVVIATLGIGWAYAANAVSFLAVIVGLALMEPTPAGVVTSRARMSLASAMEGLRFVFASPVIRSTTLLDFAATFFSSASALLPMFAQDVLGVGAHGYGALAAASPIGAALASLVMVRATARIDRRGVVLLWAVGGYGLATVLFGLSRSFWLTFACLALIGASDAVSTVIRNVVRQLGTPDHLRGRMTSVTMLFFMGGPQLGDLEAGAVANWLGAPLSVITGGIGCLIATGWTAAVSTELRRYRKERPRAADAGAATA